MLMLTVRNPIRGILFISSPQKGMFYVLVTQNIADNDNMSEYRPECRYMFRMIAI